MRNEASPQDAVRNITLSTGENVEVLELRWKDSLRAIKEMCGTVLQLLGPDGGNVQSGELVIRLDRDRVVAAIVEQESLLTWVLMKSTARDQEWVDGLGTSDALALIQTVVDLNLNDEVLSRGKALAGTMSRVFATGRPLPGSTTSSSVPATP